MNQKYHVQVSMNQAAIVKTGLVWKQGDFGFQVEIEVLDFDTSGTTPQIVFRKSAGAVESTDVSVVGNVYTYTFKGTELDVPGFGVCDLKLKNSTTQRISTASFMYECIADTLDGLNEHANSYSDTIAQIIDGYEQEVTNLKNSLNILGGTEGLTCVKGAIQSNGEIVSGTTDPVITSSPNRVTVGPFFLDHSIEISCDSSINYILFYYGLNQKTSAYCQCYSGWQTSQHIIGMMPGMEDQVKFYIMLRYANNGNISNPDELLTLLCFKNVDASNPLHLMACGGIDINDDHKIISETTSGNHRCVFKKSINKLHNVSANVNFGIYKDDVNTSITSFGSLPVDSDFMCLLNNTMHSAKSFEELYETLGLSVNEANADISEDLEGVPSQIGTVSSAVADENWDIQIGTSTNRVVIGPFYLNHSVEISCDSGVSYIVYNIFLNNNHSQTTYHQHFGWQTSQHIFGNNPKYKNVIKYYILARYTNDGIITSSEIFKTKIHLKNVDNDNPLNIIDCATWNPNNCEPVGNNTALRRLFFEDTIDEISNIYFANNITISKGFNNVEVDTPTGFAFKAPQCKASFMIRKDQGTGNTFMQDFSTFKDLYDRIGYHKIPYNFKEIQGTTFDNDFIYNYNAALSKGSSILSDILNGKPLLKSDIGFSHTPTIFYVNDQLYVVFTGSTDDVETMSYTTVYVAEVDLENDTVVYHMIARKGETIGGVTFDEFCNNAYSILNGNTIDIFYTGHINGVTTVLVHGTFDITNNNITNTVCSISANGSSYEFSVSNFNKYIGREHGINSPNGEFVMGFPIYDGTYFYTALSSGDYKDGITPLLKSTDLNTWEFMYALPMELGSDCEAILYYENGFIFGAFRHEYKNNTLKLFKMNLSTYKIMDSVQIPDCGCRPTWFAKDDELFLIQNLADRHIIRGVHINKDNLAASTLQFEFASEARLGYNYFTSDGTNDYIAIQCKQDTTSPRIYVAKITTV